MRTLGLRMLSGGHNVVGERGFQTRIALTRNLGNPRFLQDCSAVVDPFCVPVQCVSCIGR